MSPRPAKGSFPKADADSRAAFEALFRDDDRVLVRPMFGNLAAFVNGNMFAGVFGEDLFIRLSDENRSKLIEEGGSEFSPMPGRAMKEYAALPRPWKSDLQLAEQWIDRSLAFAATLPPKKKKK